MEEHRNIPPLDGTGNAVAAWVVCARPFGVAVGVVSRLGLLGAVKGWRKRAEVKGPQNGHIRKKWRFSVAS